MYGAFLVDSFYYFKNSSSATRPYMEEMLTELYGRTGLVFMAVCSGGAALVTPADPRAASYEELLARVPVGVTAIVAVVCGNDLLSPRWKTAAYKLECDAAVLSLCHGMRHKSALQFAVVGGSAATWGYDASWYPGYDTGARELQACFSRHGLRTVSGAAELPGLDIKDYVGHVKPSSRGIVFRAYGTWVDLCLASGSGSADRGSEEVEEQAGGSLGAETDGVQAPVAQDDAGAARPCDAVPPSPPKLPKFWNSVWSSADGAYWYQDAENKQCTWQRPPLAPARFRVYWDNSLGRFYLWESSAEYTFWFCPGTQFYKLLGVDATTEEAELRKSYRKRSLECHPDKGGDEAAFKELGEALAVLTDGESRALYDLGGELALERREAQRERAEVEPPTAEVAGEQVHWRLLQEGEACLPGGEYKLEMATGLKYERVPAGQAEEHTATLPPEGAVGRARRWQRRRVVLDRFFGERAEQGFARSFGRCHSRMALAPENTVTQCCLAAGFRWNSMVVGCAWVCDGLGPALRSVMPVCAPSEYANSVGCALVEPACAGGEGSGEDGDGNDVGAAAGGENGSDGDEGGERSGLGGGGGGGHAPDGDDGDDDDDEIGRAHV